MVAPSLNGKPDEAIDSAKKDTFEVFFDYDKSTISDTAAKIILEAATSAKNEKVTSITLSVHTRNSASIPWSNVA